MLSWQPRLLLPSHPWPASLPEADAPATHAGRSSSSYKGTYCMPRPPSSPLTNPTPLVIYSRTPCPPPTSSICLMQQPAPSSITCSPVSTTALMPVLATTSHASRHPPFWCSSLCWNGPCNTSPISKRPPLAPLYFACCALATAVGLWPPVLCWWRQVLAWPPRVGAAEGHENGHQQRPHHESVQQHGRHHQEGRLHGYGRARRREGER